MTISKIYCNSMKNQDIAKKQFETECGVSCQLRSACVVYVECDVAQGHAWNVVFTIMTHPLALLVGLISVMIFAKRVWAMTATA